MSAAPTFFLMDSIVSSADALRVYVSLVATVCPLLATRLKRNCPLLAFFTTNFIANHLLAGHLPVDDLDQNEAHGQLPITREATGSWPLSAGGWGASWVVVGPRCSVGPDAGGRTSDS